MKMEKGLLPSYCVTKQAGREGSGRLKGHPSTKAQYPPLYQLLPRRIARLNGAYVCESTSDKAIDHYLVVILQKKSDSRFDETIEQQKKRINFIQEKHQSRESSAFSSKQASQKPRGTGGRQATNRSPSCV